MFFLNRIIAQHDEGSPLRNLMKNQNANNPHSILEDNSQERNPVEENKMVQK